MKCPICKTLMKKTKMTGMTERAIALAKEGISTKDEFATETELMWRCPKCYRIEGIFADIKEYVKKEVKKDISGVWD